jgi:hypothetical protein
MTEKIDHLMADCKKSAMLIPFGYYKNVYLLDMKAGDELITEDDPPAHIKILNMHVIPSNSPLTDAISNLIYGYPIEVILKAMEGNHGASIHRDKIILIIYEHIYTESFS